MKLLIKGGRLVDPGQGMDKEADILIEDGTITNIKKNISARGVDRVLEAADKVVMPGFIDLHVHLREPGYEYKEDIASGTKAAVAGGFTALACMPNTEPVMDNPSVVELVKARSREARMARVYPVGAITKGQKGTELSEMYALAAAGCVGFSDDGHPVMNSRIMRLAMQYARIGDWLIMAHEEDLHLTEDGQMHEGFYSTYYGLKGIPAAAEEVMVARDIILAAETGARLHICHASTRGSIELVRQAKKRGLRVSCEVTPHHLTLTDEMLGDYDTDFKVNPPLRSREHVETLIEGILDGTVDAIATDHAPHDIEAKHCEFGQAANGISGLETAVAVIVHYLVNTGKITWGRLAELYSLGPARVLRIAPPSLSTGARADITIIDPELIRKVEVFDFYSKGQNNPYKGQKLKGWPWATIVEGRPVYLGGRVLRPEEED